MTMFTYFHALKNFNFPAKYLLRILFDYEFTQQNTDLLDWREKRNS